MTLNRKRFVLFLRHNFAFYCGCNCRKENFDDAYAEVDTQFDDYGVMRPLAHTHTPYHQCIPRMCLWKGKIRFIVKFEVLHSTCEPFFRSLKTPPFYY